MTELPHVYTVVAVAGATGDVALRAARLPALASAPPAEFGGPRDRWSPESLLSAAVADCFVLTFRALARRSNVEWIALTCEVDGTVDRVDRMVCFTRFALRARLRVPAGSDVEAARRLLDQAERKCLISNSLAAQIHLDAEIDLEVDGADATARVEAAHR